MAKLDFFDLSLHKYSVGQVYTRYFWHLTKGTVREPLRLAGIGGEGSHLCDRRRAYTGAGQVCIDDAHIVIEHSTNENWKFSK